MPSWSKDELHPESGGRRGAWRTVVVSVFVPFVSSRITAYLLLPEKLPRTPKTDAISSTEQKNRTSASLDSLSRAHSRLAKASAGQVFRLRPRMDTFHGVEGQADPGNHQMCIMFNPLMLALFLYMSTQKLWISCHV